MNSEMQIKNMVINDFRFKTNPLFDFKKEEVNDIVRIKITRYRKSEDSREFFVELDLSANTNQDVKKNHRYALDCKCQMYLEFDKNADENLINQMMEYTVIVLMISQLRGIISQMTANAPFGKYILPTLDMKSVLELLDRKETERVSKKKQTKKITHRRPATRKK